MASPPSLPALAPRPPGAVTSDEGQTPSKEHTTAEWAAMRGLIKKLYVSDNRKLCDIMRILETQHGFSATVQMYKKRLRKWGIRKRTYRKAAGSDASPSQDSPGAVGAQDEEDVEEISRDNDGPANTLAPQPSGIEAFTNLELVLSSVCSWSEAKLDANFMPSDAMSMYLANPNQPPIQDSRTMYRTFELVFDLWNHGNGGLAGMAARKGFYVLEFVLTEDHPDLIWHVLDTIYDMVDMGHLQLLGMFLEHATVLARKTLPSQHPLFRILHQLRRCDYRTSSGRLYVCHILRQAWLRNVHLLGQHIGSLTSQHLWLYEQLIWDARSRLRRGSDLRDRRDDMIGALEQLSSRQRERAAAPNDGDADDVGAEKLRVDALMLEYIQMDLGDQQRAEQLALDLLRSTEGTGADARSNARFHAYARKMLARTYEGRGDLVNAEQNLRCAITKREAAHGASNSLRVVRDMWVLAAHFERAGRQEDADSVAQDAISRAQNFLYDVSG